MSSPARANRSSRRSPRAPEQVWGCSSRAPPSSASAERWSSRPLSVAARPQPSCCRRTLERDRRAKALRLRTPATVGGRLQPAAPPDRGVLYGTAKALWLRTPATVGGRLQPAAPPDRGVLYGRGKALRLR